MEFDSELLTRQSKKYFEYHGTWPSDEVPYVAGSAL